MRVYCSSNDSSSNDLGLLEFLESFSTKTVPVPVLTIQQGIRIRRIRFTLEIEVSIIKSTEINQRRS